jgi:hypothetical protein
VLCIAFCIASLKNSRFSRRIRRLFLSYRAYKLRLAKFIFASLIYWLWKNVEYSCCILSVSNEQGTRANQVYAKSRMSPFRSPCTNQHCRRHRPTLRLRRIWQDTDCRQLHHRRQCFDDVAQSRRCLLHRHRTNQPHHAMEKRSNIPESGFVCW